MELSIHEIDATSADEIFYSALDLRRLVSAERDPDLDPDTETLFRARSTGTETFAVKTRVACADGEAVGLLTLHLNNLATNTDKMDLEIEVRADFRRRGVGTALLREALKVAESEGRSSIIPYNVNSAEARGFWSSFGLEIRGLERESRLWLGNTDAAMMADWVNNRVARADSYRLEHYRGITPPHLLPAAVDLMTVMNDAPKDDIDWDDDVWTAEDIIQLDTLVIGRGGERWTTIALGPNDEPAGLTSVTLIRERPRFAQQGNTAVDPTHRNRGIGRWLKADMWQRLRQDAPEVEAIDTENAESNAAMLAINVAMGFEPLLEWAAWQADVTVLRELLRM